MVFLRLLAACRTTPVPAELDPSALARGLPGGEMTLMVSDVEPAAFYDVRVVGALPDTDVRVLAGVRLGTTCPPIGNGACVDIRQPKVVATLTADATGTAQGRVFAPGWLAPGRTLHVQAAVISGLTWYASNLVSKTVVAEAVEPPGGNVLILVGDDLGVDKVGAYGVAADPRTPNLDTLASEGVLFRNAWATPWCSPTRAALLTGRHPRRTGIGHNLSAVGMVHELDLEQITLAELVEYAPSLDYATSYVGKWHVATFDSPQGTLAPKLQGFDYWNGAVGNLDVWSGMPPATPAGYFNWQRIGDDGGITVEDSYATTVTVNEAIVRMRTMPEPWLMVVGFNAAHQPYDVPPDALHTYDGLTGFASNADRELAVVEAMDDEVGRLLGAMTAAVRGRTHVVFLGDNGTPPAAQTIDLGPNRAKGNVYDGGVRVPMIWTGPGVAVGATSEALVSVVDVFPTVAELAGVDTGGLRQVLDRTAPLALDGRSLLPVLADPALPHHDTLWAEMFYPAGGPPYDDARYAIRDARYKLLQDQVTGTEQFFEYVPGALDEGPDLLPCGLTEEQAAGYATLKIALDAQVAADVFDALPFSAPGNEPRHEADLDPTTACPPPPPPAGDSGHSGDTGLAVPPGSTGATGDTGAATGDTAPPPADSGGDTGPAGGSGAGP